MKKYIIPVVVLAFAFLFFSCYGSNGSSVRQPVTRTIKYQVRGSASTADITMSNAGGNTEQLSKVELPWEKTFTVIIKNNNYYFAYISAQNNDKYGTIRTRIFVDGKEVESAESDGAYVIATVSRNIR